MINLRVMLSWKKQLVVAPSTKPQTITSSAMCPFPLELEGSNIVELDNVRGGSIVDGKGGFLVDTQRSIEKVMVRFRRQASLDIDH